jgi:hypothetical protein
MMARRGGNNVCISKDGRALGNECLCRRATGDDGDIWHVQGGNDDGPGPRQLQAKPRLCGVAASTYTPRTHRPFLHAICKASAAVSSPVQHHHSPPALRVPLKDVAWSSAAIYLQSSSQASQASQASRSLICRPTTSQRAKLCCPHAVKPRC